MGGENDWAIRWAFLNFVHENRAHISQPVHHEPVMHNLMAHIDRCAPALQGALNNFDGAVNARTEAARASEADGQWRQVSHGGCAFNVSRI